MQTQNGDHSYTSVKRYCTVGTQGTYGDLRYNLQINGNMAHGKGFIDMDQVWTKHLIIEK